MTHEIPGAGCAPLAGAVDSLAPQSTGTAGGPTNSDVSASIDELSAVAHRIADERNLLLRALRPFAEAFARQTNPGDSDLDSEQPYHVTVTLGDCRKALSAIHQVQKRILAA